MIEKNPQTEIENGHFDEMCERYLIEELSEAAREQFEEAYFADDALFERFLAVKDELLDTFARGELAEKKRVGFEKRFSATASRRRQIDETREFISAVSAVSIKTAATNTATVNEPVSDANPKSSLRQTLSGFFNSRAFAWQAALAVFLLIALGGIWIFVRRSPQPGDELTIQKPTPAPSNTQPSNENNNIAAPSPTTANVNQTPSNQNVSPTPTPQKTIEPPPKIPAPQIASVLLLPVASRSISEANTLRINPETQAVRVSVVFKDDNYRNFGAEITTIDGTIVWQKKTLKANSSGANKNVTLQIPTAVLRGQDYIVTLKGQTASGQTETINEYYFRVERSAAQQSQKSTPQP